jgi:chromosome segregation ATPase
MNNIDKIIELENERERLYSALEDAGKLIAVHKSRFELAAKELERLNNLLNEREKEYSGLEKQYNSIITDLDNISNYTRTEFIAWKWFKKLTM